MTNCPYSFACCLAWGLKPSEKWNFALRQSYELVIKFRLLLPEMTRLGVSRATSPKFHILLMRFFEKWVKSHFLELSSLSNKRPFNSREVIVLNIFNCYIEEMEILRCTKYQLIRTSSRFTFKQLTASWENCSFHGNFRENGVH